MSLPFSQPGLVWPRSLPFPFLWSPSPSFGKGYNTCKMPDKPLIFSAGGPSDVQRVSLFSLYSPFTLPYNRSHKWSVSCLCFKPLAFHLPFSSLRTVPFHSFQCPFFSTFHPFPFKFLFSSALTLSSLCSNSLVAPTFFTCDPAFSCLDVRSPPLLPLT